MTTVSSSSAREQLPEMLNRARYAKERVIITRRNAQVAALVPMEDVRLLERLEEEFDRAQVEQALEEAGRDGTVSWESIRPAR